MPPIISLYHYIKRASYRSFVIDEDFLERITVNPKVVVGKPVIKGTRLTVEYILGLLAHGTTMDEALEEYPGLGRMTSMPVFTSPPRPLLMPPSSP